MNSVIAKQAIHTASVAFLRMPLKPPLTCLRSTLKETSTYGVLAPPLQSRMRLGGHSMIMRSFLTEKLKTFYLHGILMCWKVFLQYHPKIRSCTARKEASNRFSWMMITATATHLWALATLCVHQSMAPTSLWGSMAWMPCTTHIVMCLVRALDLSYTSVLCHE